MKVVRVAETALTLNLFDYPLEESGYNMYEGDGFPTFSDELFEAAGRVCYQSFSRPNPKTATNETYLKHILNVGHYSILEHASVTYYVEGVSRAMLLELERHRFLSFSVISQRYVDSSEAGIVIPPVVRDIPDDGLPFAQPDILLHMKKAQELYSELVEDLMERGLDRKTARGAARCVLPEGTETKFFVTGNIRAWRDIIGKRNSEYADQEIREFAQEILKDLKTYSPNALQDME